MKKYLSLLIILLFSCNNNDENKIAIVIHGGAGIILKENISKTKEDSIINKLDEAISKGWEILKEGKSSEIACSAIKEIIKRLKENAYNSLVNHVSHKSTIFIANSIAIILIKLIPIATLENFISIMAMPMKPLL